MRIFLDMDGVLARCHMGALEYYGVYLEEYPHGMRVKQILEGMGIRVPATNDDFWAFFDHDFWFHLKKTDFCLDLIDLCSHLVGQENVYIASKPAGSASHSGKAAWVEENLPFWMLSKLILIHEKAMLAWEGDILIDDHPVNCFDFRAAGGSALLVERPWNEHEHMSWESLRQELTILVDSVK